MADLKLRSHVVELHAAVRRKPLSAIADESAARTVVVTEIERAVLELDVRVAPRHELEAERALVRLVAPDAHGELMEDERRSLRIDAHVEAEGFAHAVRIQQPTCRRVRAHVCAFLHETRAPVTGRPDRLRPVDLTLRKVDLTARTRRHPVAWHFPALFSITGEWRTTCSREQANGVAMETDRHVDSKQQSRTRHR